MKILSEVCFMINDTQNSINHEKKISFKIYGLSREKNMPSEPFSIMSLGSAITFFIQQFPVAGNHKRCIVRSN